GWDVPVFYDPLISKLVAWAEDRPRALNRMRRALDEYLVTGIKTTLPFFRWLFQDPGFRAGVFHTTYLDDVLKSRNGRSFVDARPESEEIATIAMAIHAFLSSRSVSRAAGNSPAGLGSGRWRAHARTEALQELDRRSRH